MGRRRAASAAAAVVGGGAVLLWPAFLNGYPLVFVDTASFLHQTAVTPPVWDKPVVYGPLLHAFHWRGTLWPAAAAQALLLSWLLWRTGRMLRGGAGAGAHLLLVLALSAATAAPWFASLLMPDVLAPALVLAAALLGWGEPRPAERAGLLLVSVLAAAAHLSHLPLLGALLLVLAALGRWRGLRDGAAALVAAVLLVVATNAAFQGRAALSPHGAVFAVARLVADGPAARTIEARCPGAGWHLCRWAGGRLPTDSDEFLWSPDGPAWAPRLDGALPGGPISLAPEAGAILRETLAREPWGVLRAAAANTVRQLLAARTGDTLVPDHLPESVAVELARSFPAAENARFAASLQFHGTLPAAAAPFLWPHVPALAAGTVALVLAAFSAVRRGLARGDGAPARLPALRRVGVLANAGGDGRAQRAARPLRRAHRPWLLPLAGLMAWCRRGGWRGRRAGSPRRPRRCAPGPPRRDAARLRPGRRGAGVRRSSCWRVVKGVAGFGLPTVGLGLCVLSRPLPEAMALMLLPTIATNVWQAVAGGAPARDLAPVALVPAGRGGRDAGGGGQHF
jgi:hypothetical protein